MVNIPKPLSEEEKCLKLSFRDMKQEPSEHVSEESADTNDTNGKSPKAVSDNNSLFNECNFRTRNGGMKPY